MTVQTYPRAALTAGGVTPKELASMPSDATTREPYWCLFCGSTYRRDRRSQKYCSVACHRASRSRELPDGRRSCRTCGVAKDIEQFPVDNARPRGHRYVCKKCTQAAWAEREARFHRVQARLSSEQLRLNRQKADPAKAAARRIYRTAVLTGRLSKPSSCSDCGRVLPLPRIQGHHEDYSKPLDVVWVCQRCHGIRHRKVFD